MQTTLEPAEKHTVRLAVEVPPEEFKSDIDAAYRKVAGRVRIPGFRKGKAPRQVIDAMVGREAVLEEFVHDSIPVYYVRAIDEHELTPIAEPEIDVDDVDETKPLRFTATVEVRPRVELEPEDYEGLHVDAPSAEPTEQEVDQYIDHLRERFAELEVVSRPARPGDYVLADVRGHIHDREVPEVTRVGYLAEVGSGELLPELDRELEGARSGDILKFNAVVPGQPGGAGGSSSEAKPSDSPPLQVGGAGGSSSEAKPSDSSPGQEIAFQVLVKEVKSKKLPAADDEFATTASEFDTLAELREDIRTKLRGLKEAEVTGLVRDLLLRKLIESVQVDLPDRLVDRDTERHVRDLTRRAERAGVTLAQALEAQGVDELAFRSDARAHAIRDLTAELALEAVARREGLTVSDEDLDREVAALAKASRRDQKEVRRILERSGEMGSLAGDIIRSKALDLLVERADVVSQDVPEARESPDRESPDEEPAPALPQTQGEHDG